MRFNAWHPGVLTLGKALDQALHIRVVMLAEVFQNLHISAGRRDLIGKTGIAISDLRPSGRAEIDGETMIVVADGEFVERGLPVTVTDVRGNRVVVSKA